MILAYSTLAHHEAVIVIIMTLAASCNLFYIYKDFKEQRRRHAVEIADMKKDNQTLRAES